MQQPPPFWPRGLLAGALLAVFLVTPVFVLMVSDATAETARRYPDINGRMALFQLPLQLRAQGAFFDGKLSMQAVLAQRFTPSPRNHPTPPMDAPLDDYAGQSPESARSIELRLRLENHSAENLAVEIVRVESVLGDVVTQPDRLLLAPHQTASISAPVAEQRVPAGSIPVDVALRLAGKVETRHLQLNDRYLTQARN